jgi:hypothetical protein
MQRPRNTDLAFTWALSSAYAASTMWHRLSLMGAVAMMSDADRQVEATRMVGEKLAAGVEGGLNAGVQAMHIMADIARGKLGPAEFLNAPSAIMNAGLQPALRRARANSRRLNRRSRSGKG